VLGTRTVLTAAAEAGVPEVLCPSTGKARRILEAIEDHAAGLGSRQA
jgi:hypothetical protein